MRVTKTIREFIEKEVSNRLDAKYTAEKEEADFQTKVEQDVWEAAMDAAMLAALVQMARGGKDEMAMYMLHNLKPYAIEIAEGGQEKERAGNQH